MIRYVQVIGKKQCDCHYPVREVVAYDGYISSVIFDGNIRDVDHSDSEFQNKEITALLNSGRLMLY